MKDTEHIVWALFISLFYKNVMNLTWIYSRFFPQL